MYKDYIKPALLNSLAVILGEIVILAIAGLLGNEQAGWGVLAVPTYVVLAFLGSLLVSYLIRNKKELKERKLLKYLPTILVLLWTLTQLGGIT